MILPFLYLPLYELIIGTTIFIVVWIMCGYKLPSKIFRICSVLMLILGLVIIVCYTLIGRPISSHRVILVPFITLQWAISNPEYYRTLFLNILLFLPLGLGLAGVLYSKVSYSICIMIMLTAGFFLSAGIELMQYYFSIGDTEVDDVICNTGGVALAVVALKILKWLKFKSKG